MRNMVGIWTAAMVVFVLGSTADATSHLELKYYGPGATEAAWTSLNGGASWEGPWYTGVYKLQLNSNPSTYSGDDATKLVTSADPSYVISTFCMDVRQEAPTSFTQYEVVQPEAAPIGGGNSFMSPAKADALRRLFSFYSPGFDNAQAGAFEAAVWEIVYETGASYNVYNGSFKISEYWGSGWGLIANGWLNNLSTVQPNNDLRALVSMSAQDYALTIPGVGSESIPEPVTMAGLMMGIGGLVTYIRKRRKA